MFTGIIQELGSVISLSKRSDRSILKVAISFDAELISGESIGVNGVCLTAISTGAGFFEADVSAETMRASALALLRRGDGVNIERALSLGDRLGGHLVYGHVDGVGRLAGRRSEGNSIVLTFEAPESVMRYVVEKGSIAVDGVSLTVYEVGGSTFSVSVIPHTAAVTTLGNLAVGSRVNLETDVIGRYVEKFMHPGNGEKELTIGKLREYGYL